MGLHNEINTCPNYMTYNGEHLFHFTSFMSAIKIITSNTLLFGDFKSMNDISESRREVFDETVEVELSKYKSISFTLDKCTKRGFEIDSLWGYYANKGNGACLVFNKKKLIPQFRQMKEYKRYGKIRYLKNFTNAIFLNGNGMSISEQIKGKYKDIFFTKSKDWSNENEYRLLIKTESDSCNYLPISDALIAIIICHPLADDIRNTIEYKVLRRITNLPILHYHTRLGNKNLTEIGGPKLWPLLGVDIHIDI